MRSFHHRIILCTACLMVLTVAHGLLSAQARRLAPGDDSAVRAPASTSPAKSPERTSPANSAAPAGGAWTWFERGMEDPRTLWEWGSRVTLGLTLLPAAWLGLLSWRLRRELRSLGGDIGRLSSHKRKLDPQAYHYADLRACARELEDVARWLQQEQGRLTQDATRDSLTGLPNRRSLMERLSQELASSARTGWPLSFIMVDLDRFKKLNDTYGHQAGDFVLKRAAERMASLVRQTDMVARFGGEEFAVILPHADLAQGMEIAWQLCNALRCDLLMIEQHSIKVSASFGVAEWPHGRPGDADALVRAADMALYQAKEQGRDTVVAAPTLAVTKDAVGGEDASVAGAAEAGAAAHGAERKAMIDADTMALMGSTFSVLQVIPDKHRVAHDMLQQVAAALECQRVSLFLRGAETDDLRPAACVGVPEYGAEDRAGSVPEELAEWFAARRASGKAGRERSVEIVRVPGETDAGLTLRIPLTVHGELIGAIEAAGVPDGLENAARPRRLLSAVCLIGATALSICDQFSGREERWTSLTEALCNMIQTGKPYKCDHAARVSAMSVRMAVTLGQTDEDELRLLRVAGLVLDIGEITIPERILEKRGRLRASEWRQVQEHARVSAEIVGDAFQMSRLAKIVLHHHEHYDGTGYPDHLVGEQIPLESRIIAVADAYVAMVSDRPHRRRMTHADAVERLIKASGAQFDPIVINAFLRSCLPGTDENDGPGSADDADRFETVGTNA